MKEEEEEYHNYLNGNGKDEGLDKELLAFLEESANVEIPAGRKSKSDIWSEIDSKIEESPKTKTFQLRPWQIFAVAAAISLLVLALPRLLREEPIQEFNYATNLGETKEIELPDKSIVMLNAGSQLTYLEGDTRDLTLSGEAFFSVTEGKPFSVQTTNGTVTVLGTSFNVKTRDELLEVTCKSGKVNVAIPEKDFTQDLNPQEGIVKEKDTIRQVILKPELIGKWQTGEFYFDNRPLNEVLDELSRQYSVSISAPEADQKLFTGYFTNQSLDLALTIVCEPLGLSYEIAEDGNVIITNP